MTRRPRNPGRLDRQLAPRPLAAHLASAVMLWLSSRAALPNLNDVSLLSSVAGAKLRALAHDIDAAGPEPVTKALDEEIARRARSYLAGLETYRIHPFRRPATRRPVLWQEGTTRLLDYGADRAAPVVLVVPSLVNRYYVLDLLPERSFLGHLADRGLRPLVVDWGMPGRSERGFALTDYIAGRLDGAFATAAKLAGAPLAVLGYCMGGLLALALALRRGRQIGCLAVLATPWDFHAEREEQAQLIARVADCLPLCCGAAGVMPVDLIQSLFFFVDPFLAQRKFIRFASLDANSDAARSFVALEDWINDGVPLALRVAQDCLRSWYRDNEPVRGLWHVAGRPVRPQLLRRPVLVVVPGRDRIVPPASAEPLAAQLMEATVLRPPLGHVGMMSAARAPTMLWTPLAEWLRARLRER